MSKKSLGIITFILALLGAFTAFGCGLDTEGDALFDEGSSGGSSAGGGSGSAGASNGGMGGNGGSSGAGQAGKAGGSSGQSGSSGKGGAGGTSSGSAGGSGNGGQGGFSGGPTAGSSGSASGVSGMAGSTNGGAGGNAENGGMSMAGNSGTAGNNGAGTGGAPPVCGNNLKEDGEFCDGTDLNQQTCLTIPGNYSGGTLKCLASCGAYDMSSCTLPTPCTAGATGTVDNFSASGAIETSLLIHFQSAPDYFSASSPTINTFNGQTMPGQMVVLGKEGLQFDLKNGATPVSQSWFRVASFPSPQCDGANLKAPTCLAMVAKAFRCQHAPYNEGTECPAPVTFTEQPATNLYTSSQAGYQMVLVDLRCP